MFIHTVYTFN